MRFKTLLGLMAIGGAVAYAQKKRGGELSFNGIKNSLRSAVDNVKGRVQDMRSSAMQGDAGGTGDEYAGVKVRHRGDSEVGTSNLGSVGGEDDVGTSTGYSQGSSFGSEGMSPGIGSDTTGGGIGGRKL